MFVHASGGYGSPFVTLVGVLEAVFEGVSVGEAGGLGAACRVLARGRALVLSGIHGEDTGAGHTGSSFCNSFRG